ncbi:hypothetical protein PILCRDRAFT_622798 [Piloderma croceum F 1598]|uniref:Fungal STAND N-terminal Goodbye domain-containing protein n=1 Tax=Piloderma croceum (strain F 1598) TaxID=765440 RepID=A0A0C3ATQ7_PILCF|nr:hypothetical protein PILCRDRAFT_622798 [Piloderma croceum F 1598]
MSDLMRRKLDSIKAKLPSKTQMATALSLLHMSLNVFKEVASKTPVPGLSEGVKALVIVLEVIQKAWQNADDVESFAKCIQELTATLERATGGDASLSPSMQDRIQRLSQTWIASAERLQDIGSQSRLKRLAKFEIDAQVIADVIATVTWSIRSFTVETLLAIEFALDVRYCILSGVLELTSL